MRKNIIDRVAESHPVMALGEFIFAENGRRGHSYSARSLQSIGEEWRRLDRLRDTSQLIAEANGD